MESLLGLVAASLISCLAGMFILAVLLGRLGFSNRAMPKHRGINIDHSRENRTDNRNNEAPKTPHRDSPFVNVQLTIIHVVTGQADLLKAHDHDLKHPLSRELERWIGPPPKYFGPPTWPVEGPFEN